MNTQRSQSRVSKWGWGILLAISILLALNGVLWFFVGPQQVVTSLQKFGQVNPAIARQMATNARQVAIWYLSFGLLALLVTLEGFLRSSRWAWYAAWILVPLLAGIGVLYMDGFGVILLGLAAIALVGQLLAGKGLSSPADQSV
ncbi:MAG TPA: hypothetical protein VE136_15315 [Anaerolineales bacterium]|jgi:hypothetical protein|nr:hypothetical protein [Anaerolineales bacterium]